MIYVVATLIAKPGAIDTLRQAVAEYVAATRTDSGCIAYDVSRSLTAPDTLVVVEKWETRADLSAHSKQPHLVRWRELSAPHLVARRIEIVHPERIEEF